MARRTWTQLTIPGLELEPTPALARGDAYLTVCRYCGVVMYVPGGVNRRAVARAELDPCPACSRDAAHGGGWAPVKYSSVAGFRWQP